MFKEKRDKKCMVAFVDWFSEMKPKYRRAGDTERVVASTLGFAGTLDLFCYLSINEEHDTPFIIDFKTSGGIYDNHKLQIAAYKHAFLEMTGIDAQMGILHLNPRTKKGYAFHTDLKIKGKAVEIEDFMTVFATYKMLNGGKVPEPDLTVVYPEKIKLFETKKRNGKNK